MFKRKKVISNSISNIEMRICDLEHPYLYNNGDIVDFKAFGRTIQNGIIIKSTHSYRNIYNRISENFLYVSPYIHEIIIGGEYVRNNTYLIYVAENKESYEIDEKYIKK